MSDAESLIIAFAEYYGSRHSYVSICKHGGEPGYVHVVPAGFDPAKRKDRHVAVELYNGTVCVTERLKDALKAQPRPKPEPSIKQDPSGHSAGPNYGRFGWSLTFQAVKSWNDGLRGFVKDVAQRLDEGAHEDD
jgi:hypothetical protein